MFVLSRGLSRRPSSFSFARGGAGTRLSTKFSSSLRFSSPGLRSFSQLSEIEQRVEGYSNKTSLNQTEKEELDDLKRELLGVLRDQKVKDAFQQLDAVVSDLGRRLELDIESFIQPPNFNLARQIIPFNTSLVDDLQKQWDSLSSLPEKKLPPLDSFPPIQKLQSQLVEVDSKIDSTLFQYKEISKKQSAQIVEKMKEVAYLINNFTELTFDSEFKRRPDLATLIDEEILHHHWDPNGSEFGKFETNPVEIERVVLGDLFGATNTTVTSYTGDLKLTLKKLEA